MIQEDEKAAIAMRERHKQVIEEEHLTNQGQVIQYYGDDTLSMFDSAVNAVQCAISIQNSLTGINPYRSGLASIWAISFLMKLIYTVMG